MKKLSTTMKDCLHYLLEHGADEQWVQVNVGGWYNHNTLKALERRGLIDLCYRTHDLNPNNWPELSPHQSILNSYACAFNDPWVRLLEVSK